MSETAQANDGAMLPLSSLPTSFLYDGGFISTITVSYAGSTYVQTFVNDGTDIIYISGWINPDYPNIGNQAMVDQNGEIMVTEDGQVMVTE